MNGKIVIIFVLYFTCFFLTEFAFIRQAFKVAAQESSKREERMAIREERMEERREQREKLMMESMGTCTTVFTK